MSRDEIIEILNIDEPVIFLDPQEWDEAIIGITADGCHLIYGYNKLAEVIMKIDNCSEEEAYEWINYNTIQAIQYMDSNIRPIIIYEV